MYTLIYIYIIVTSGTALVHEDLVLHFYRCNFTMQCEHSNMGDVLWVGISYFYVFL